MGGFAQNYDFILNQLKFLEEKQSSMPNLNRPLSARDSNKNSDSNSRKSKNNPRNKWETQSLSSFNTEIKVNDWMKTKTQTQIQTQNTTHTYSRKSSQTNRKSKKSEKSKNLSNYSDFYSSTYFTSGDQTENESLFHDLDYATDAVQEVIEIAAIDQHFDDNFSNLIEYSWKNPDAFGKNTTCNNIVNNDKDKNKEKENFLIEKARSDF